MESNVDHDQCRGLALTLGRVAAVARDTIDGVLEPRAQAIVLTGATIGPSLPACNFVIPTGATSGQVGMVFGYKSGADYWLSVRDMSAWPTYTTC